MRRWTSGLRDVVGLDDNDGRDVGVGECLLDAASTVCIPGSPGGRSLMPVLCTLASAAPAMASASNTAPRQRRRGDRAAQHPGQHGAPDAGVLPLGLAPPGTGSRMRPFSTWSAEQRERCRQHRQRADIATATTMIVPTANDANLLSPVRTAGHRDHHREAGHQDRPAGGGRRDAQGASSVS